MRPCEGGGVGGNYSPHPMRSHVWMAVGLAAGLALGLVAAATQQPLLLALAGTWLRPVGTLFLNLLSMVVIPLVATALFAGVAGLGDIRKVGRLGLRTLGFFWGTTLAAILIGFVVAAMLLPLAPIAAEQQTALRGAALADSSLLQHGAAQAPSGARFIVDLVPANPLRAAVDGNLLPLIVFVTIFAVAGAVAQFGWSLVKAMAVYVLAVILGLAIFIAGVYLPAIALIVRVRLRRFLRGSFPSMLMGFSTTSSLATLPTMLDAAAHDLKISRMVSSFVLPLGATVNRAGSALFQAVAVLFVARLYGVPFGSGEMFQAGAAVFLASLTVASIPYGSIVSLAPAFASAGLPLSGLTLLIGLDRIPDMFRTMTNVTGHLTAAAVVAAVEGEKL